ncbi:MAG: helix-turn-helix domain-containing protein [Dehalococcoidia bacterium]|nr:MAG: helix-turn-helix domain-containing protein [Dehalococcoidia bacterium]
MAKKESRKSEGYKIDQLLTIRDASRLLGFHASTIRRWCRTGLLKEYRIGQGHHRRFRHADVIALLVEQHK